MGGSHAVTPPPMEDTLRHEALFYRTPAEFLEGTSRFVRAGLDAGAPVFVAVPGHKIEPLRADLGRLASRVGFVDMTKVGRNPSRIIPTIRRFTEANRDRRVQFVGEPIWTGRSPAEIREGTRHEALLNVAFADTRITIFCPYDARLDRSTIADARRTHPTLLRGQRRWTSRPYTDPAAVYAGDGDALPPPPAGTEVVAYGRGHLPGVRRLTRRRAAEAGLGGGRVDDVVLAVNEIASNTLSHAGERGTLSIWLDAGQGELVCEIRDGGYIADPLAGRRQPSEDDLSGRGLWIVNQLCDLVELRSGVGGTVVRLHVWTA
jgi:anti-sigma regulatory factor (Ser/Thr protein kinase)